MGEENLVLIIDDDCDIHFFLRGFFRKSGIKTIHSETLNDAKSKILNQPSFVLLDNQLPDGLGIEFIPQIQALAPNAVIIVMTAYMPLKSKREALERGVDFFIEKPFSLDQMKNLFSEVLQS